jgi:hypothetical protein
MTQNKGRVDSQALVDLLTAESRIVGAMKISEPFFELAEYYSRSSLKTNPRKIRSLLTQYITWN